MYSFGVVMLELLTGKKAIKNGKFIVHEVRAASRSPDGVKVAVDPVVQDMPILLGMERFFDLALRCVEKLSVNRPTMRQVVKEIESILENDGIGSSSMSMTPDVREPRVVPHNRKTQTMASRSSETWMFSTEMCPI